MTCSRRALLTCGTALAVAGLCPVTVGAATSAEGSARRVAMVSTSAAWTPDGDPTGLWLSELSTPYWTFIDAGMTVDLASVAG